MKGKGRPSLKLPIQTMKAFYAEGATLTELAAAFGVSLSTVHVTLREAGAVMRRGRPRHETPNLARRDGGIGLSVATMHYYRRTSRGDFRRRG